MKNGKNMNSTKMSDELFMWCLEQSYLRLMGKLSQYKIDKLNSIGFNWDFFEKEALSLKNELDKDILEAN